MKVTIITACFNNEATIAGAGTESYPSYHRAFGYIHSVYFTFVGFAKTTRSNLWNLNFNYPSHYYLHTQLVIAHEVQKRVV